MNQLASLGNGPANLSRPQTFSRMAGTCMAGQESLQELGEFWGNVSVHPSMTEQK